MAQDIVDISPQSALLVRVFAWASVICRFTWKLPLDEVHELYQSYSAGKSLVTTYLEALNADEDTPLSALPIGSGRTHCRQVRFFHLVVHSAIIMALDTLSRLG